MTSQANQAPATQARKIEPVSLTKYPPLNEVTRDLLTTDETAFYLGLKPQTLRKWHCEGRDVIRPVYLGRKPMYRKSAVQALIAGEVAA
ncbi:helix-turn-helix domain-containing protein [Methylomonas rapida]|uniref:Helix-turn-helix domain-containing protein n=1 Tax=Methylomonas rapida TaxID=2963939 RepID=A0ABY7GGC6_9GAMM|nr:helix-turn-helix domain-containing protein [Methylomonas rapida]WAR43879.1 helix-turn-helix domain-containing protein [Methylomonas rapida]